MLSPLSTSAAQDSLPRELMHSLVCSHVANSHPSPSFVVWLPRGVPAACRATQFDFQSVNLDASSPKLVDFLVILRHDLQQQKPIPSQNDPAAAGERLRPYEKWL